MVIDGVRVIDHALCDEDEIKRYIRYIESKVDGAVTELRIEPGDKDFVSLSYVCLARKFERIRRITGKPIRIARKVA